MEQQQVAILGAAAVVLLGAAIIGATMFFDSNGTVTRELPETASPGDTVVVKLHFNLTEPQTVTVKEALTGAYTDTRSLSTQNMKTGKLFYDITIPNSTTGTLTFDGTISELGITISGDETLVIQE